MQQLKILRRLASSIALSAWLVAVVMPVQAQESAATVSTGKHVAVEYTLKLDEKTVFETNVGSSPFTYVQGSQQIVSGLEKAMEGMKVGEHKRVTVSPEEGYGMVSQEAFVEVAKAEIPSEAQKVGTVLQGQGPNGKILRARVAEIKDDSVVLDFNHPLAGKTLHFDVKVVDIQSTP